MTLMWILYVMVGLPIAAGTILAMLKPQDWECDRYELFGVGAFFIVVVIAWPAVLTVFIGMGCVAIVSWIARKTLRSDIQFEEDEE